MASVWGVAVTGHSVSAMAQRWEYYVPMTTSEVAGLQCGNSPSSL